MFNHWFDRRCRWDSGSRSGSVFVCLIALAQPIIVEVDIVFCMLNRMVWLAQDQVGTNEKSDITLDSSG